MPGGSGPGWAVACSLPAAFSPIQAAIPVDRDSLMIQYADNIVLFIAPENIEPAALKQIENVAVSPVLFKHVAVMPDCHLGKGATVGTVIATRGGIIPAAVGVDIGCGMIAVRTSFDAGRLEGKLKEIRQGIERRIPLSAGHYNRKILPSAARRIQELKTAAAPERLAFYDSIDKSWEYELGSLGSGNHFIEILKEASEQVWVVLHSGSRGIGNKIASRHISVAKGLMKKLHVSLPDADLAYLPEG